MDSYVGEIRIFAGMFAPMGWADCNGQEFRITEQQMLYAVIGNTYGGSPGSTFAVPNLNGRVPVHQGAGPGLTPRAIAQSGGAVAVALQPNQMPAHTHVPQALDTQGALQNPNGAVWARGPKFGRPPVETPEYDPTPNTTMNPMALGIAGGGQPHNNLQPYVPVRFIIALEGEFPVRP